jgi:outer membrane immunogenic protein
MKKLFVAAAVLATLIGAPALAADMALKAPSPAPSCAWCGWYVGGNVGYGWGEKTDPNLSVLSDGVGAGGGIATFLTTGFPGLPSGNLFPNLKPSGALGGLQVGYDQQYANWVLGVVADIQAADWSATNRVTTPAATGANVDETLGANVRWFGTVRARAGVTTNNVLFYGTGGLAYGQVAENVGFTCTPGGIACAGINFLGSSSTTRAGWAAGAGIATKVGSHVSIGLEFLHVDLGRSSVTASQPGVPGTTFTESQRIANDLLRVVLNYGF